MNYLAGSLDSGCWPRVRAGDALTLVNGRAFKPSEWKSYGLPIIRIQNLNNPVAPFNYFEGHLPDRFRVIDGDLLFAWSGTPGTSFGAHIWRGGEAWLNQHIFNVRFDESEFDRRFLCYAINQNLNEYIRLAHGGAGLAHITKRRFEDSLLPKPSLFEQCRIVAEIEKQLTRLDAGVTALKRIQVNLKRYRAAVLKAACEGRLVPTEAELARREGRSYEHASVLLERIKAEKARLGTDSRRRSRRSADPTLPPDLPPLPEGWAWATLPWLGELNRGKSRHRPRDDERLYGGRYPFVQTGDIRKSAGTVREHSQSYSEFGFQQSRLWPAGTLCVTIAANIAETAILSYPACFPDSVVGFLPSSDSIAVRYLEYFIRVAKENLQRFAPATAQKNINLTILQGLLIPIPPSAEQSRIVSEVERRISVAEDLDRMVAVNLQRSIRLRQSALAAAFAGRTASDVPSALCNDLLPVAERKTRFGVGTNSE